MSSTIMVELENPLICRPGFKDRLWALLDEAGLRERGRQKLLADWAGLSATAMGNILREDRPPSHTTNYNAMIDGLLGLLNDSRPDSGISRVQISKYLLSGIELLGLAPSTVTDDYASLDVSAQGRIHVSLSNAGKKIGVNVFSDIEEARLKELLVKVAGLHKKLHVAIESDEMCELMKTLINIAHNRSR